MNVNPGVKNMALHVRWSIALLFSIGTVCLPASAQDDYSGSYSGSEPGSALTIVGGLSGANIYLTYLSLESIADNFSCGNYSENQAWTLTTSLSNLIEKTVENLRKAQTLPGVSAEDYDFLARMIDAYSNLQTEALYLLDYTASLAENDLSLFLDAKHRSWEKIQDLLGLEDAVQTDD